MDCILRPNFEAKTSPTLKSVVADRADAGLAGGVHSLCGFPDATIWYGVLRHNASQG